MTSFPRRNKKKQRVFELVEAHEMQGDVDKEDVSMAEVSLKNIKKLFSKITFLEVMNVDEAKMVSGIGNDKARRNKKGRKKNRKVKKTRAGC